MNITSEEQQNPGANRAKEPKQESMPFCPFAGANGLLHLNTNKMTLGNGYLGSRIDEERSEMRYLV